MNVCNIQATCFGNNEWITKLPSSWRLLAALTMSEACDEFPIWACNRCECKRCCTLATRRNKSDVWWSLDKTTVCVSILLKGSTILALSLSTADNKLCTWVLIIARTPSIFSTHVTWDSKSSWFVRTCLCNSASRTVKAKKFSHFHMWLHRIHPIFKYFSKFVSSRKTYAKFSRPDENLTLSKFVKLLSDRQKFRDVSLLILVAEKLLKEICQNGLVYFWVMLIGLSKKNDKLIGKWIIGSFIIITVIFYTL